MNTYDDDKHAFVFQTMLTCIGNKRKLVNNIKTIIDEVRTILSKDKLNKLNIVDGFAGSSVTIKSNFDKFPTVRT